MLVSGLAAQQNRETLARLLIAKMDRPFSIVDNKVYEADFFLEHLSSAGSDFFAARCYFSAFVSATRSITFTLQAALKDVDGFDEWYRPRQQRLLKDPNARFFVLVRNLSQKAGYTPINLGSTRHSPDGNHVSTYWFSDGSAALYPEDAPRTDAVAASRDYLKKLVQVVFECYCDFAEFIDPQVHYSITSLRRRGWSVEDVEEYMGFQGGWTAVSGLSDDERIAMLQREIPDATIDRVFKKYLGRVRPSVDETPGEAR